jgi:hypothetical protein
MEIKISVYIPTSVHSAYRFIGYPPTGKIPSPEIKIKDISYHRKSLKEPHIRDMRRSQKYRET